MSRIVAEDHTTALVTQDDLITFEVAYRRKGDDHIVARKADVKALLDSNPDGVRLVLWRGGEVRITGWISAARDHAEGLEEGWTVGSVLF